MSTKLPMISLVEAELEYPYIKKSRPALQIVDGTSDLLRSLLTESSANQILTFNDSPPPGASVMPSAIPSVRPPL